jgi:hypothetical protein
MGFFLYGVQFNPYRGKIMTKSTTATTAADTARNESVAKEIAFREKLGMTRVSVAELKALVQELGYRFNMELSCKSLARYLTGERAGQSYPSNSLYPVQIDDGKSFAHVDARRDANFERLQKLRDSHYAAHGGYIYQF